MKRGFTLIELLAVIVILAIIALIATPIVLNIINDAKESATLRSADFYIDALENEIMLENMNQGGSFNPNTCIITNGTVLCDGKEITLKVDGEKPNGGSITFVEGKVTAVTLTFGDKTVSMDSKGQLVLGKVEKPPILESKKACSLTDDKDSDGVADTGDMITCSTESFYVISNDGKTISMLTEYNLDVGRIYNSEVEEFEEIENPTGIQNEDAIGDPTNSSRWYGITAFSTTNYWYSIGYIVDANYASEGRNYPFVYGDYKDTNGNYQNKIYPYIKSYEEYLIKEGVASASATLISYEQLIDLGCDEDGYSCYSSQYDWTHATSYWTGSAYDGSGVWDVYSDGGFQYHDYDLDYIFGVRPVVNISVSEI